MPLYDKTNKYHKKIMKIARKATQDGVSAKILSDLEKNYLDLCKE